MSTAPDKTMRSAARTRLLIGAAFFLILVVSHEVWKGYGPELKSWLFPEPWQANNNQAFQLQQSQPAEAERLYRKALAEITAKPSPGTSGRDITDKLDLANLEYTFGIFLISREKFKEAKHLIENAHQIDLTYNPSAEAKAKHTAHVCMSLADCDHQQFLHEHKQLPDLLWAEKAVQSWQALCGPQSSSVGNAYMRLGNLYDDREDYANAEQFYRKGIELLTANKLQDQVHDYLTNLVKLNWEQAQYYDSRKDFKKSQYRYSKALEIATTHKFGDWVCQIICDQTSSFLKQKKYAEAVQELPLLISQLPNVAPESQNNWLGGYFSALSDQLKPTSDTSSFSPPVKDLLATKNYKAMDQLADRLRGSRKVLAAGSSELGQFYEQMKPDKKASDDKWNLYLASLREWIHQKPESITARVALADALVSYAWKARGSGFANTVSKEGWKKLEERLTQSQKVLDSAKSLKDSCPGWYWTEQTVALTHGWDRAKYEELFTKAIQLWPAFDCFYYQKVNYLLPKWNGEPGEWVAFAKTECDRRSETEGKKLYARIILHAAITSGNSLHDPGVPIDWDNAKAGFELLLKEYPESIDVREDYAKIAYAQGHPDVASQVLRDWHYPAAGFNR